MTKRITEIIRILSFTLLVAATSCNSNTVFTDSKTMARKVWALTDLAEFSIPVTDTATTANIDLTIRTGSDYPYRNIWLFVSAVSPNGKSITDTLNFDLADEKGNWYGKGFGDIHELVLPYKKNVFFPVKGTYKFKVRHGMRSIDLKGVYDFGLRIEKYRKK